MSLVLIMGYRDFDNSGDREVKQAGIGRCNSPRCIEKKQVGSASAVTLVQPHISKF